MKRSSLLQHLRRHGCYLKREGRAHSLWCNPQTGEAIQKFLVLTPWAFPEGHEAGSCLVGEATGSMQKIPRPFLPPQSEVRWSHHHPSVFPFAQGKNGYGPIARPVEHDPIRQAPGLAAP
jgi:hypothetical protein